MYSPAFRHVNGQSALEVDANFQRGPGDRQGFGERPAGAALRQTAGLRQKPMDAGIWSVMI